MPAMPLNLPTLADLDAAAETVYAAMPPTPQIPWPLLAARAGLEVWVKHENHTPIGAFKVRGGLIYMDRFRAAHPGAAGIITATRGNHGQSVAYAARAHGLEAVVVVPQGNSVEKNAAMRAFGGELIEHGADFQEAREFSGRLAADRGLVLQGPYEEPLVHGVATYARELLTAAPHLDTIYVPIGMGSGISGCIAARDALGLTTRIVGVVAEGAPSYALSFEAGHAVPTNRAETMADGLACRVPDDDALEIIRAGAERIITVDDTAIEAAMRAYFQDIHQIAEGAGAAPLAALLQDREAGAGPYRRPGAAVGLILSGGNIDRPLYTRVLADGAAR